MKVRDALKEKDRKFCGNCGGTRFRWETILGGMVGIAHCTKCKAEGSSRSVLNAVRNVVRSVGGRWEYTNDEARGIRAAIRFCKTMQRLVA